MTDKMRHDTINHKDDTDDTLTILALAVITDNMIKDFLSFTFLVCSALVVPTESTVVSPK